MSTNLLTFLDPLSAIMTCPVAEHDTLHGLNFLSSSGQLFESTCKITPASFTALTDGLAPTIFLDLYWFDMLMIHICWCFIFNFDGE